MAFSFGAKIKTSWIRLLFIAEHVFTSTLSLNVLNKNLSPLTHYLPIMKYERNNRIQAIKLNQDVYGTNFSKIHYKYTKMLLYINKKLKIRCFLSKLMTLITNSIVYMI